MPKASSWTAAKHVVLEACNTWEHVYDAARQASDDVVLAHPSRLKLIAEASLKNDKVDADALSELLRLNGIPKAYAPDPATRELRQLVRDRQYYKRLQTSIKNHVYGFLLRRGIQYEDGILGLKRKRETLRHLRLPPVDRGLDALHDLNERCADLDEKIHDAFQVSREARLLASIPGIGELTAVTLVAELCPITRFANVEKVCSYAGLVPTVHQSGETSYHGHMKHRESNLLVKTVLIEATWSHRRYAPRTSDVTKLGNRVARRRGGNKGAGAAAHKLLKIVYAVLKRGTPYTPQRPSRDMYPAEPPRAATTK
jgi:transposase